VEPPGLGCYGKHGKYIWKFSRRKNLIGNSAEFESGVILNREPVKRFQKCDRMRKPRRRVTTLSKQF